MSRPAETRAEASHGNGARHQRDESSFAARGHARRTASASLGDSFAIRSAPVAASGPLASKVRVLAVHASSASHVIAQKLHREERAGKALLLDGDHPITKTAFRSQSQRRAA